MKKMKNSLNTNIKRARGFTLVELLVTITIIIVLASLSTLAVAKMREKALTVTATKRISGLVIANTMYATENNGKYVASYSFDDESKPGTPWHYNPEFLLPLIGEELDIEDAVEFEGVDKLPEVVLDPIVVRAKKKYWSRISASFAYNNENVPGGDWGNPGTSRGHTVASVKNPSEQFAFITATDWIANYGGRFRWASSPVEGKSEDSKIAYRHQNKAIVAYYDGHCDTKTIKEIKALDKLGGINNVFWGGTKRAR